MNERIVLVDDDPNIQKMLGSFLEEEGYETVSMYHGEEVFARRWEGPPDLFLIDWEIPGMDGLALSEKIRSDACFDHVPIILITGKANGDVAQRALEGPADDFVLKPVHLDELKCRISKLIAGRRALVKLQLDRDDLEILYRTAANLNRATDPTEAAQAVIEAVGIRFPGRCCCFYHRKPGSDQYKIIAQNEGGAIVSGAFRAELDPVLFEVKKHMQTVQLEWGEEKQAPPIVSARFGSKRIARALGTPTQSDGELVGVLAVFSEESDPQPNYEEVRFLETMAEISLSPLRRAEETALLRSDLQSERMALEESKELQEMFDRLSLSMLLLESDGTILRANREFARHVGVGADEAIGRNALTFFVSEARSKILSLMEACDRRADIEPIEVRLQTESGEEVPVSTSVQPYPGRPGGSILLMRDLTRESMLREELLDTMDFLESLIAGSVDAIIAVDLAGKVVLFNKAAEKLTGRRSGEVIDGVNVRELYRPGVARDLMRKIRSDEFGGVDRAVDIRTEVINAEGDGVPILLNAWVIYKDGSPAGTVGFFTDLREKIRIDEELKKRTEEMLTAQEKQKLVSELSGAAAHELNQPLTAIVGYLELLRRHRNGDRFEEILEVCFEQADRIKKSVRRIGEITRYETTSYAGTHKILDLLKSTDSNSG